MNLDRYAILALALPFALVAGAQSITLVDPGNVPLEGTSFLVNTAPYMEPEAGGAGMVYDFSGLTPTSTLTYQWTAPDVSPNAGLFPSATLALINGGPDTVFYNTTAQGLERVGETRTIAALGDNFPAGYSDGVLEMPLPVTYGDTWSDPIAGSFTLDGNDATRSGNITGSADAYGFLSLPNGTAPIEVLRLNSYVDETISTSVGGLPVNIHHTRHVVSYVQLWGKLPVFRTVTDSLSAFGTSQADNFTEWLDPTAVGINDLHAANIDLNIMPNPASNRVELKLNTPSAGPVDLEVIDARGARVLSSTTNEAKVDLDVSRWRAGIYQVLLTGPEGQRSTRRLVVAH